MQADAPAHPHIISRPMHRQTHAPGNLCTIGQSLPRKWIEIGCRRTQKADELRLGAERDGGGGREEEREWEGEIGRRRRGGGKASKKFFIIDMSKSRGGKKNPPIVNGGFFRLTNDTR